MPKSQEMACFFTSFFQNFPGIGGDTPPNHPGLDNDKESLRYIVQKESLTAIILNIVFHYSFSPLNHNHLGEERRTGKDTIFF